MKMINVYWTNNYEQNNHSNVYGVNLSIFAGREAERSGLRA